MAVDKFVFTPTTLGKLLKGHRLMVPPNQRPYSWKQDHVLDLLQDFDDAVEKDEYFVGTVVLVEGVKGRMSVQDGQQRLATTTILLARIRDEFLAVRRDKSAAKIDGDYIRDTDIGTEATVPKLTLNAQDNEFFSGAVICAPSEVLISPSGQSNERLRLASEKISDFLKKRLELIPEERRADLLTKWVNFIDHAAWIVMVTASSEVNAYRIFETLNDRGLKASQTDILKNYLFSKAGDRLPEAQSKWLQITNLVEVLGEDDADAALITYIRHYWITMHGPTRERDLADNMRKELSGQDKAMHFLSECSIAINDYLALSNSKHSKWLAYKPTVRRNVETIYAHLQVEQIRPLMFAVALHFDPVEAEKAFRLFVTWSVRFLIVGGRGGMLDQQYALRAQEVGTGKVRNARDLREAMRKYAPNDREFQQEFAVARVSRPVWARYYLRAIEKARTADSEPEFVANEDVQDISLEHIMPLTIGAAWRTDEETAQAAQKLLGNMVLVRASSNRDMGNAPYDVKKPILASSGYLTTRDAAVYNEWNLDSIRDRQAKLAETAVTTWTLKFSDD